MSLGVWPLPQNAYLAIALPRTAMKIDWKTSPWTLVVLMVVLAAATLAYRLATGM